jgi:hypothetical protein
MEQTLPPAQPLRPRILTWLAVTAGILIGLLGLIITAEAWLDTDPNSPIWLTNKFQALGPGALGLVFLVASLVALRNRRRAGLIFLDGAPIVAFVLTYPSAGFLVWKPDGAGVFELPLLDTAVELTCLFYAPFIAPLFAIRKKKRALFFFLIPAIIAVAVFANSRWTSVLVPGLVGWSALFLLFGAFWLRTNKLGWPTLFTAGPRSPRRKAAAILIECLVAGILFLGGIFVLTALQSTSKWSLNCRGPGLFTKPAGPEHAVFTARLVFVSHQIRVSGKWAGEWAIGLVQEQFWGLLPWSPRLVLLTNSVFWEGEPFFISGRRARGLLTRYLPIVDTMPCLGVAQPVSREEVHLRVLRKPLHEDESRIIGEVQTPKRPSSRSSVYEWIIQSATQTPVAGARIKVAGSSGDTIVTTDAKGIYEISGLPPDGYTLSLLDVPANQTAADLRLQKRYFLPGQPHLLNFVLEWNGTIEGAVRDAAGNPAPVWVELQPPDGTIDPDAFPAANDKNGEFCFRRLAPGSRYMLMLNSSGPYQESPYAPIYYPSARRPEDARILEITPQAPHVHHVDFIVRPLSKRTLKVRALSPTGQPVAEAPILVAYENTRDWDEVIKSHASYTDRHGLAEIQVFGDFRIRVLAEQFVETEKLPARSNPRYSPLVELETTKLPPSVDLIISSSDVHLAH